MTSEGHQPSVLENQNDAPGTANENESVWMRYARSGGLNEVQLFIPDSNRNRILCVREGEKWMLPTCIGEDAGSTVTQMLIEEAKKIHGFNFDLRVLRWIWCRLRDIVVDRCDYTIARSVVSFECDEDPRKIPEGWEWVNIHEARIDHPEDEIRHAIDQELADMRNGTEPKLRAAWGRPGWFRDASGWMCNILKSHGLEVMGPVVQLKSTALGTVLQARTQRGDYFLKCTPVFRNEAAITEVLCRAAPQYVQKPLLIDAERRVTITADHEEERSMYGSSKKSVWDKDRDAFLRDLARFHHATSAVMEELEAASLKVYRTEWMEKNLDALLEHEELRFVKRVEELEKVRNHKEDIHAALRDLRKSNWPFTLVHNDLMEANISRPGGGEGPFCFFDWGTSFGGCPRADLDGFFGKPLQAYFEEMSALFGCDLEDCYYTVQIANSLARCFHLVHEIEHVEEQAKVEIYYYLEENSYRCGSLCGIARTDHRYKDINCSNLLSI